jgi:hypothetical protein
MCQNLHQGSCNWITFWYYYSDWVLWCKYRSKVSPHSQFGGAELCIKVFWYMLTVLCVKNIELVKCTYYIVTTEQEINIWWQRKMAHWRCAKLIYYIYQRHILWKPVTCNSQYRFRSLSRRCIDWLPCIVT